MSCGSFWTVMTWSKFVCVYLRVDGVLLVSYKDASPRLQIFLYLSS